MVNEALADRKRMAADCYEAENKLDRMQRSLNEMGVLRANINELEYKITKKNKDIQ
jgi:hypothetical protein